MTIIEVQVDQEQKPAANMMIGILIPRSTYHQNQLALEEMFLKVPMKDQVQLIGVDLEQG